MKRLPLFVLLISLGFNGYLLSVRGGSDETIVTFGAHRLTRSMVSEGIAQRLKDLDRASNRALRREAERWVDDRILSKEAALRMTTVDEMMKVAVTDKARVTAQEVMRRYAERPDLDAAPWPSVLNELEAEMVVEANEKAKKKLMVPLYEKYGVRFYLPEAITALPNLVGPQKELSEEGMVIGPPSKGPAGAPIHIEVYSDFMCPFTQQFSGTLKQLEEQYPDKLRISFKHYPLDFHQGAILMAEASTCAQEQGKFWEYYDRLLTGTVGKKEMPELSLIAKDLSLDTGRFDQCLRSGRYKTWVSSNMQDALKVGVSGTPSYVINGRMEFGAYPVDRIKPMIDWYLVPKGPYPTLKPKPSEPTRPAAPAVDMDKVHTFGPAWLKNGPSLGTEGSPVTIIEFFDYNCPFCRKGSETMTELMKRHPGKVRLIPKHFPLPMHPNASKTSQATLCADEQGKFWEYRQEVFGEFWGKNGAKDLKAIAKKLNLKERDFDACLDGENTKPRVMKDLEVGAGAGVQGTPAFFVNGRFINGAQPVESFEKFFQEPSQPSKKKEKKDAPLDEGPPQMYYA